MVDDGSAAEKQKTAPPPEAGAKPDSPADLTKHSWKYTFGKAWTEFQRDHCSDLASALTYYAVLSLFPALIALVSLLGVFGQGQSTVNALLDVLKQLGQNDVADTLKGPISSMVNSRGAGLGLVVGLLGALWSASGYVGAFGRAMNRVYEIDEGRPFWKLRPINVLLTIAVLLMVSLIALGLVFSGSLAQAIGDQLGLSSTFVTTVSLVKWPLMLLLAIAIVALLYWATPNVRQPKMRWLSVGAAIAIVVAIIVTVVFGFYVGNFGSYNKTYGSLAGVIVFLLWLQLMNSALLFGAEVASELERARQLQGGIAAEETLQLPPRDDTASKKAARKRQEYIDQAVALRESGGASDTPADESEAAPQ